MVLQAISQVSKEQTSNKTKQPRQIMQQGGRNPFQYLQAGSPRHEAVDEYVISRQQSRLSKV